MKATEIRQMTTADIRDRVNEELENLSTLHFQLASSQLADTSQIDKVRRDIARMRTILKEREISGVEKES
ncbi:MAG: 50S ribosomal protein L29 [Bacteroidetes bacterium]|nr:50S ribosomal protein L29 [Bacteroidota bacterium]